MPVEKHLAHFSISFITFKRTMTVSMCPVLYIEMNHLALVFRGKWETPWDDELTLQGHSLLAETVYPCFLKLCPFFSFPLWKN